MFRVSTIEAEFVLATTFLFGVRDRGSGLALAVLVSRLGARGRCGRTGRGSRCRTFPILVLRDRIRSRICRLGRNPFLFHTALVLALVDRNNLINQCFKFLRLANCCEGVFDRVLEADIEENAFCIIVKLQGGDGLLEFNRVRSGGLGLLQTGQSVAGLVAEIAIEVQDVKGFLEGVIILPKRVGFSVENVSSPATGIPSKERNDEQDLRFTGFEGFGVDGKVELTLGHEGKVLRDFAIKGGWLPNFHSAADEGWGFCSVSFALELSDFSARLSKGVDEVCHG